MYPKEITGWIDEAWAKGFSAEQTVEVIKKKCGLKIGLATVYRRRHGKTTRDLVDELMRQQQFDIATSDNEELKLKYRNELLKIFIPQMTVNLNKNINETTVTQNLNLQNYSEEDKIAVLDAYRRIHRQNSSSNESQSLH